jgi:hypothetical protein
MSTPLKPVQGSQIMPTRKITQPPPLPKAQADVDPARLKALLGNQASFSTLGQHSANRERITFDAKARLFTLQQTDLKSLVVTTYQFSEAGLLQNQFSQKQGIILEAEDDIAPFLNVVQELEAGKAKR